ncbi:AAA family ATPase [Candidatus Pacearchaeota archaeon]|nr:AAA family ATPase [Candidatus Pacearchaeota archaeon]
MKLKKIILRNIRSYEYQEVEFPQGSVLLAGDIGTGKTTILLGIEYALFGLQPGQKGSALLRHNADSGEVTLELEIGGKEIIIERKLRRSSKSVSNEFAAITIDNERIESSLTEIKTMILELMGYPFEFIKKNNLLYRYTVYTPQEQMKQIILEDAETRLTVLRHIFGIDKYKRIRENLALILSRVKDDSKIIQGEIKTLDDDRRKFNVRIERMLILDALIIEKESTLKDKITARKSLEVEAHELEAKLKEKENFEKEVEKTKIMMGARKENISASLREIERLEKDIAEAQIVPEETYELVLKSMNSKRSLLENLTARYMQILTTTASFYEKTQESNARKERIAHLDFCPVCQQKVSPNHRHAVIRNAELDLNDMQEKLMASEKEKNEVKAAIEKEKKELVSLEKEKDKLDSMRSRMTYIIESKKRVQELKKNQEFLNKDIALLSGHIESRKEDILALSKFNNLLRLKNDELKKAFVEEKNAEIAIAESRKELELTREEARDLEISLEHKENLKKKLTGMNELSDWLSNQFIDLLDFTERTILMRLRGEFSKLFSSWFSLLVSESSFHVQLDENFTPLIIQGDNETEYSFLSGGERTAVALAYRLALNQTINSVVSQLKTKDLVILDEPTEGFSEGQLDKMREIFSEVKVGQLIVVSHEQKIEGFVDNIIRLKKEGTVSSIEAKP